MLKGPHYWNPFRRSLDFVDIVVVADGPIKVAVGDRVNVDCFITVPVTIDPVHLCTGLALENRGVRIG